MKPKFLPVCPFCGNKHTRVIVYSKCWQYGYLLNKNGVVTPKIGDYSSVENIEETLRFECEECEAEVPGVEG